MTNFVFPSSESNFFDYSQSGAINASYPSPSNILNAIYYTLPSANLPQRSDSIFAYSSLSGQFSNYSSLETLDDFQIFNQYIHYYPKNVSELDDIDVKNMDEDYSLKIPYLSSYKVNNFIYNPYGNIF